MQPQAKPGSNAAPRWSGEVSGAELAAALIPHRARRLLFSYDGRDVSSGYHVTEVKAATFASLDCGASPEAWRETVIQLWDVPAEPGTAPMTVGKFLAIIDKAAELAPLDGAARLTFEVSDGTRAMQLFVPVAVALDADVVRVALRPRPASCKPRDRWLKQRSPQPSKACGCAPAADANVCC